MNSEIQELFFNYLDAYFIKRDLDAVLTMFSPRLTGFGTGLDEKSYNPDQLIRLYERDIEQVPDPITYEVTKIHAYTIKENLGIALGEINIEAHILQQKIRLNNLRISTVWIKTDSQWLMEHMHISLPTEAHNDDESYPIKELEERNIALQRIVEERTKELNEALSELKVLAVTDSLTGIDNRGKIEQELHNEIERSRRYQLNLSMILIDIDNFKRINDTFGHLVGDKCIATFAKILNQRIRITDRIGRWGGEEFVVVCPQTELESAKKLADELRSLIEKYPFPQVGKVTASFGVASFLNGDDSGRLIGKADKALYEAKNNGRNQVCTHN